MSVNITNEEGRKTIEALYKSLLSKALSLEPAIETFGGEIKHSASNCLKAFAPDNVKKKGLDRDFDIKGAIIEALEEIEKGSKFTIAEYILHHNSDFDKEKVIYKVGYTAGRMEKNQKLTSFKSGNTKVYQIAPKVNTKDNPFGNDWIEADEEFLNNEDDIDRPY